MGLLSLKNGYSLVSYEERDLVKVGTILMYQSVNIFGKPTEFVELKVIDKKITPRKWITLLFISFMGLLVDQKVVLAYSCINLKTRKECFVIGCHHKQEDIYNFYLVE